VAITSKVSDCNTFNKKPRIVYIIFIPLQILRKLEMKYIRSKKYFSLKTVYIQNKNVSPSSTGTYSVLSTYGGFR
jgi:hypothetical protein